MQKSISALLGVAVALAMTLFSCEKDKLTPMDTASPEQTTELQTPNALTDQGFQVNGEVEAYLLGDEPKPNKGAKRGGGLPCSFTACLDIAAFTIIEIEGVTPAGDPFELFFTGPFNDCVVLTGIQSQVVDIRYAGAGAANITVDGTPASPDPDVNINIPASPDLNCTLRGVQLNTTTCVALETI